jgi:hypothetical protein
MKTQVFDTVAVQGKSFSLDDKMHTWKDKLFRDGSVFTLFFMPTNFGSVITRMMKQAAMPRQQSRITVAYPIIRP